MIDHQNKIIYIHISKCAGSTIENALGLAKKPVNKPDFNSLYGWSNEYKLFLHHATPQELFDNNLLDEDIWNNYFKFIIVRNPWDRAYSDYFWFLREQKKYDKFQNFLLKKGRFSSILNRKNKYYRGDHLTNQIDYFFLNEKLIEYDMVLRFEKLKTQLPLLTNKLSLPKGFFSEKKTNVSKKKYNHYSKFYNNNRRKLIQNLYSKDIQFLDYSFEGNTNEINGLELYDHFKFKTATKIYLEFLNHFLKEKF